jgi:hypothetical protein
MGNKRNYGQMNHSFPSKSPEQLTKEKCEGWLYENNVCITTAVTTHTAAAAIAAQ